MKNKPCGNCHKDHEGKTLCGKGKFGDEINEIDKLGTPSEVRCGNILENKN